MHIGDDAAFSQSMCALCRLQVQAWMSPLALAQMVVHQVRALSGVEYPGASSAEQAGRWLDSGDGAIGLKG